RHQVGGARGDRVGFGCFGCAQFAWARGLFWISELRPVANHLALVAAGEKGKSLTVGRTFECKKSVTVDSGKASENFVQLFASHTLDRIPPNAFDRADDAHLSTVYEATAINETNTYRVAIITNRFE